jgi:hypothetical protein
VGARPARLRRIVRGNRRRCGDGVSVPKGY